MAQQVTNYICPNCGGPVHFDAATGKVKCDYCDSIFTIEEVKAYYEKKNREAAKTQGAASASAEADAADAEAPNVETAAGKNWGSDAAKLRVYHCGNCGAQLITDETTAATTCPYCGNPAIIPGQFSAGRKPDYVVPFACEKEKALEKLQEYYKGKKLLPKSFTSENHLEEMKGVYVPYWMYSGSVDADLSFECGKSQVTQEGDEEVTRTRLYRVRRAGTMQFEKIPCDASSSMPDDLMDSIEPYDYSKLRPFELEYLPGYLANKYDVEAKDLQKKADERAVNTSCDELRGTVSGYDEVRETQRSAKVHHTKTEYALMPVWLLYTRWKEQDFLFAMNGQTQKMTGNLPVSPGKTVAWFAGVSAAVLAFMAVIMMIMGPQDTGTAVLISVVVSLLVGAVTVGVMIGQMKPVARATHAERYLKRDQSSIRIREDQYLRTIEKRTKVSQPQQGGPKGAGKI